MTIPQFSALTLTLADGIAEVRLNRPDRSNALSEALWQEIRQAFDWIDDAAQARVAILSGAGRHFCSGIDLGMLTGLKRTDENPDGARGRETLRRMILDLQDCLSSIERCRKPVLAAIHGACIGGAIDLVTCCDMRYVAAGALFSVREIDLAVVADVGTLQRLPRLIGDGQARELCFTGRNFDADEAVALGLANRVFASPEALTAGVREIAAGIAAKSPLAMRGTKEVMNFSREHSVADGLNFVATWNAAMLLSGDLDECLAAQKEKRAPRFTE